MADEHFNQKGTPESHYSRLLNFGNLASKPISVIKGLNSRRSSLDVRWVRKPTQHPQFRPRKVNPQHPPIGRKASTDPGPCAAGQNGSQEPVKLRSLVSNPSKNPSGLTVTISAPVLSARAPIDSSQRNFEVHIRTETLDGRSEMGSKFLEESSDRFDAINVLIPRAHDLSAWLKGI